jgi:hypothetical protein
VTEEPFLRSVSTRWLPMNPAPPVMNAFMREESCTLFIFPSIGDCWW